MTNSNNVFQLQTRLESMTNNRLLLVDDSVIELKILRDALKNRFQITFASSVDDAINLVASGFTPDIVLLDILMPGKHGYEFCEYLKSSAYTVNIPVIFVSSLNSIDDRAKGFNFGAVDYITKPYKPLELQIRLLSQLEVLAKIKHLENLANIDSLTQVANRRKYELALSGEWERCLRHNESLALIMIDIDNFKAFNDCYGHAAGDDCLVKVAKALSNLAENPFDLFARYGGEEFVLLLPECNSINATLRAQKALRVVQSLQIKNDMVSDSAELTISVGAAVTIPNQADDMTELFNTADRALYKAKNDGKNCCSIEILNSRFY